MESDLVKHALLYSGVEISVCTEKFNKLYKMLSDYFLGEENKEWFVQEKHNVQPTLFWELFSFGKMDALKNGEAAKEFDGLQINECYLVQLPEYNLRSDSRPAYRLKGGYDVTLLDDDDRETSFKQLKEFIRKDVPIPFWVIDNLSSVIGKEIYVFDYSMAWVLVLTHENEVYLHKSEKKG